MARLTPSTDVPESVSIHARRRIRYIPEFDGLRGLAAIFVVAVHMFIIVIPPSGQLPNEIPGTFVFMDLFFVLSGFLITALLLREQSDTRQVGLLGFYRRRAMRLLPALYVMLVAHAIYAWTQGPPLYPGGIERDTLERASLYGLNFRMDTMFSPVARGLTQLWSLGVEEQFYLVWPIVVILLLGVRRKLPVVLIALGAAIAAVVAHRYFLWNDSMTSTTGWLRLYTHTDTRADSLLIGALVAYLWVHDRLPPRRVIEVSAWIAIPILGWFLLGVKLSDPFAYKGGFTLMAIAWAMVILACIESEWPFRRILRWRVLRTLGEVSYGIYLWHVPLQYAVKEHAGTWAPAARVIASLVLTALFVTLSWFLVEKPFLRWKDRVDNRSPRLRPTDTDTDADTVADADTVGRRTEPAM